MIIDRDKKLSNKIEGTEIGLHAYLHFIVSIKSSIFTVHILFIIFLATVRETETTLSIILLDMAFLDRDCTILSLVGLIASSSIVVG